MTSPLPRPLLRLVWSNLAAQSAEQLSLAAVPIVAVLALLLRLNEPARQLQAAYVPYALPFGRAIQVGRTISV